MKSYQTEFKSFQRKILQKLQNSIQTLIILWPVYPIHTNSLFWVIFEELPFCQFPPRNTSFILGKDSQIWLIFHLNILVFQTNGKQPYSFPALSRFWSGLWKYCSIAFFLMVTHLVQHNKQHHMKVLLNSFHMNCHTLGFHPQTWKLEPPCTA